MGDQSAVKFHNADHVRRLAIICQHQFCDPKIICAQDAFNVEPLFVRLSDPCKLDLPPAADSFSRLRIIEYCIIAINFMFGCEVARIGCRPVTFESGANIQTCHQNHPDRLCSCQTGWSSPSIVAMNPATIGLICGLLPLIDRMRCPTWVLAVSNALRTVLD
jgi:hypothetical protein